MVNKKGLNKKGKGEKDIWLYELQNDVLAGYLVPFLLWVTFLKASLRGLIENEKLVSVILWVPFNIYLSWILLFCLSH